MKSNWDVIVVGGGPAGSMSALHSAKYGASVLMLEKDREIGVPVRCAEGVSVVGLQKLIKVDKRWIKTKIDKIDLISPNNTSIKVKIDTKDNGYILDRRIFDNDLALLASQSGVTVKTKSYVHGLTFSENGSVNGIKANILGKEVNLSSKIVIGADGVESRIGRFAGLKTALKMSDIETCVQAVVSGIAVDSNTLQFYIGEKYAPGGYLWVFPKGKNVANIGLGILGDHCNLERPKDFLEKFLSKYFPNGSILNYIAGGVPVAKTLDKIVTDGLVLVGDAARTVNPISGGGIISGMNNGKLAGIRVAEAIKENNFTEKFLKKYKDDWYKVGGKNHERLYKIKNFILSLTDNDFDHIAKKVSAIPIEKRSVLKVFKIAVWRKPSLILDVVKAFSGF
jgi:digeranylgeranylglycerophospholipid reductase